MRLAGLMGLVRTRPSREILSGDSADVYFARAASDPRARGPRPARHDGGLRPPGRDPVRDRRGEEPARPRPRRGRPAETQVEALDDGDAIAPKEVVLRIRARYRAVRAVRDRDPRDARPVDRLGDRGPRVRRGRRARCRSSRSAPATSTPTSPTSSTTRRSSAAASARRRRPAPGWPACSPTGTMPHSLVLIFGDTVEAAVAFDRDLGPEVPRIVLVDTFKDEAEEALRVAHALGDRLYGIRLDTPVGARPGHRRPRPRDPGAARPGGLRPRQDRRLGRPEPRPDPVLQGRRRAGRLVRRRLVHQRRHADRLHRRHQGDRRPPDREARPDPGSDRVAAAPAGRPRLSWRDGIRLRPARGRAPCRSIARAIDRFRRGRSDRRPRVGLRAAPARPGADEDAATTPRRRSSSSGPHARARQGLDPRGARPGLYNSGQHERSRETFEALLEVDPSAHYAHYALGQSLKQLGRTKEARTHLRLAVALSPTRSCTAAPSPDWGPRPKRPEGPSLRGGAASGPAGGPTGERGPRNGRNRVRRSLPWSGWRTTERRKARKPARLSPPIAPWSGWRTKCGCGAAAAVRRRSAVVPSAARSAATRPVA